MLQVKITREHFLTSTLIWNHCKHTVCILYNSHVFISFCISLNSGIVFYHLTGATETTISSMWKRFDLCVIGFKAPVALFSLLLCTIIKTKGGGRIYGAWRESGEGGWRSVTSFSLSLSRCLSCSPSSSLSDHNPDLEGFLLAKRLTGDGCTEGGWVYKGGMGFDKATGPASRQCFIKRGDLWHIFFFFFLPLTQADINESLHRGKEIYTFSWWAYTWRWKLFENNNVISNLTDLAFAWFQSKFKILT